MPSLTSSITALVALVGLVGASPVELEKRRTFSIDQVQRKIFEKNGARSTVKTLRKFGAKVPENLLAAAAAGPNGTGTAEAVPGDQYDSLYLSPVDIAGSTVHLDFDTGSADLYVNSLVSNLDRRFGRSAKP